MAAYTVTLELDSDFEVKLLTLCEGEVTELPEYTGTGVYVYKLDADTPTAAITRAAGMLGADVLP